jgi:hypothetical protein
MTVEDLRERMSAQEFMRWFEFDRTWTSDAWRQTALLCSVIHNTMSFGGKRKVPADFLPIKQIEAVDAPTPAVLKRKFGGFAARHNARIGLTEAQRDQSQLRASS